MIVSEDLLLNMKKHFASWMDIRRKIDSSTGGLVLKSISEETENINEAIKKYTDLFFLTNFIKDPDSYIYNIYKTTIGGIDNNSKFTIVKPDFKIVDNEKDFYDMEEVLFIKDGILYVKENIEEVQIIIDGYKTIFDLEPHHVWNIYDEFAIFLGLRRFEKESNSELLNRILKYTQNKVNSSEDGLKHALISNLINIDNSLTKEDIIIETTTPENLSKYYDEYENLLEHLNKVNRDVYKEKRWDIDSWNFDIKSIDYIPHYWDIELEDYTNGVGFEDDLKIVSVDKSLESDVTISLYKKDVNIIHSYIKNNDIRDSKKLKFRKYTSDLISDTIKYKITASEAMKLDTNDINIISYEEKVKNIPIAIEEIESNSFDIDVEDNSILEEGTYIFDFFPIEPDEEFAINQFKISDNSTHTDLLNYNKSPFEKIQEGIKCSNTKIYAEDKHKFSIFENMKKTLNGFELKKVGYEGKLKLNIDGCDNQNYFIKYDSKEVSFLTKDIFMNNFFIKNDYIVSDSGFEERFIEINKSLNSISFTIENGFYLEYSIDGINTVSVSKEDNISYDFSIPTRNQPFKLWLKITSLGNKETFIKNIKYSHFNIVAETKYGQITELTGTLPNFNKNELTIKIETHTGYSPVIKKIYIGSLLSESDVYDNIKVKVDASNRNKIIYKGSNCRVRLRKINEETNAIEYMIDDFKPVKKYIAKSDWAQIELNLKDFKQIDDISTEVGNIESINYGEDNTQIILQLKENEEIKFINVSGSYDKVIDSKSLTDVLKSKGLDVSTNHFYISKESKHIICYDTSSRKERLVKLDRTDLFNKYNVNKVFIDLGNHEINAIFIENNLKIEVYDNFIDGYFDYLALVPKSSNTYVAYNSTKTIFPYLKDIEIVNTFNNNFYEEVFNKDSEIIEPKDYLFKVESITDNYTVKFQTNDIFELCNDYSLNSKKITIKKKDLSLINCNYEDIEILYNYQINTSIAMPEYFILNNGNKIITSQYILKTDLDLNFKTRLTDPDNIKDYEVQEKIMIDDSMFSKLKYSYIDYIDSITYIDEDTTIKLKENKDYIILKEEGIIIWNNFELLKDVEYVIISYAIKKIESFNINLDELYSITNFNIDSYKLVEKIKLEKIKLNNTIDLNTFQNYTDIDIVNIECSNNNFCASINNSLIAFNKKFKDETLAIKSGYYYFNGQEFYMFADDNINNIEKFDNVELFNVTKNNKKLIFNQDTTNYVKNSNMKTNVLNNIFERDFTIEKEENDNLSKSITSCETYNYWKTNNATLSICTSYNGEGLKLTSLNEFGYAFLKISNFIKYKGEYVLSFYLNGNIKAYLGKERNLKTQDYDFNETSIIDIVSEIKQSDIFENIHNISFNSKLENYYLIIKGEGEIDDINVVEKDKYDIYIHSKNLDALNLDIEETIYYDYKARLYLNDDLGAIFDGTEIKNNIIENSSNMNWGFTPIYSINTKEKFQKCIIQNADILNNNNICSIITDNKKGRIITNPISINNSKAVKNLVFKINNVAFNNMTDFSIKILTSNNANSGFKEISKNNNNIGSINGEILQSYIKLDVEIKERKVIESIDIFVEYFSTELNNPTVAPIINGTYISKVLDVGYAERFKLNHLNVANLNQDLSKYKFFIRASKMNSSKTVWTDWEEIIINNIYEHNNIRNRLVYDKYRYFQLKTMLNGENAKIQLINLDMGVI